MIMMVVGTLLLIMSRIQIELQQCQKDKKDRKPWGGGKGGESQAALTPKTILLGIDTVTTILLVQWWQWLVTYEAI